MVFSSTDLMQWGIYILSKAEIMYVMTAYTTYRAIRALKSASETLFSQ
jgi:hypothetical protein